MAVVALVAGSPAGAQAPDPDPEAPNQLELIRVDNSGYPTVDVIASVPLPDDRPLLAPSAFTVSVGPTRRPVETTPLGTEGVEIALVVDAGSAAQLDGLRDVAAALLRRLSPGVSLSLVQSGAPAEVVVPLTADPQQIASGLATLTPQAERSSDGAVAAAIETLSTDELVRPAVVLLSAAPEGDRAEAVEIAVDSGRRELPIHLMTLGTGEQPEVVNPYQLTGGNNVVADVAEGFVEALDAIAQASRGHYRLVFTVQRATPERVIVRVAAEGVTGEREVAVEPPPGALRSSGNGQRGPAGQVANQLFPVMPVAAAAAGAVIVFLGAYYRRRRRGSWG